LASSFQDGTTRRETAPEAEWDDERGNEEASFGIEFTDWAEWLGMEIDPQTADRYPELAIIGHCLWEMTFVGIFSIIRGRGTNFTNSAAWSTHFRVNSCHSWLVFGATA